MRKSDEIKAAIDRLHDKGSGDFQTLLRQVENHQRQIQLNLPQVVASMSRARTLLLEWGRGAGKTTMRGYRWSQILLEMPRSTGLHIGPTYQAILTRIVPSLVQGLEMFGIYENLHYFIGRLPPRTWRNSWGRAFQPPAKYDKYITFWNGTGVHLISHDVPGDGRGLNTDWIDGDEAAMLDGKKLQENTDPTLRGTSDRDFRHSRFYGSKFYTSSTPLTPEGQWFLDYENKAVSDPKAVNFVSATCDHNAHNLRQGFLEEAERDAYAEWVFLAEYKNVRPKFVKDGFYNLLDKDIHCYTNFDYNFYDTPGKTADCRGDADLVKGVALDVGVDWGATINCLTVNQHLSTLNEYRTLKSMYVLGEDQKIQDDLFKDFDSYYQYHDKREINLWYDNSGNIRTGIVKHTRAEKAAAQLRNLGWKVNLCTIGMSNVSHELKFLVWSYMMREDDIRYPRYRMNKENCRELYLSMKNAKAVRGLRGEIKKDKSSEKSKKIPRQEATDLSDANDTPIMGKFAYLLAESGVPLPGISFHRPS